ncbi:MAG TPA: plastocyanin/azurin family copper-binding protein [Blastocatellia bacterium]
MKKFVTALALLLSLSASQALAGNIRGKINGKVGNAVVWVEGIQNFEVPANKPSISQRGMRFFPSLLVVVAGQSVQMPNDDNVAHNVFSFSPTKKFNLGIYPKGEYKEVTFEQPGIVDLFCSIHHQMKGRILVVPNPFYYRTRGEGTYLISSVPAGKYTLKMWNESGSLETKEVTVPAKGDVTVDF